MDGLQQLSGARDVIELHGSLSRMACPACGQGSARADLVHRLQEANAGSRLPPNATAARVHPDGDVELPEEAVRDFRVVACAACDDGMLKPDVVFFGENVPPERVAACRRLVDEAAALLVLGSTLTVMSWLRSRAPGGTVRYASPDRRPKPDPRRSLGCPAGGAAARGGAARPRGAVAQLRMPCSAAAVSTGIARRTFGTVTGPALAPGGWSRQTQTATRHWDRLRSSRRTAYLELMEQAHVTGELYWRVGDVYAQLPHADDRLARIEELRTQLRDAFDPLMRCVRVIVLEGPEAPAQAARAVLEAASEANSALWRVSRNEPQARERFDEAHERFRHRLEEFITTAHAALNTL
ncbi:Sir2 family NAD-dependent protein deacetylase [Streptomyces longisporoflavus]|uniref:protein acetyllysine N-acetyltransferase n=1 Tax=Streptomyces longisporoflavus TaxID=28044 RepID=A0ABW7R162_9ACTN